MRKDNRGQGRIQREFRGFSQTPFDSKFHFHGRFWINLINLGHFFILLYNVHLLPVNVCKIAEWVANCVDPDQTPRSAASDLGLHCLLRYVCPNTFSKYGNMIKSNLPQKILLDPPCKKLALVMQSSQNENQSTESTDWGVVGRRRLLWMSFFYLWSRLLLDLDLKHSVTLQLAASPCHWILKQRNNPAGTWRKYNVASTLHRRWGDVVFTSCACREGGH